MKRFAVFLAGVFLIAGCGAQPAPELYGGTRHDVRVEGRNYVLFQRDKTVEVIRLGFALPGEHQAIRARMIDLVPQVTGCNPVVSTLRGDSGEMRMRVSCPRR